MNRSSCSERSSTHLKSFTSSIVTLPNHKDYLRPNTLDTMTPYVHHNLSYIYY